MAGWSQREKNEYDMDSVGLTRLAYEEVKGRIKITPRFFFALREDDAKYKCKNHINGRILDSHNICTIAEGTSTFTPLILPYFSGWWHKK